MPASSSTLAVASAPPPGAERASAGPRPEPSGSEFAPLLRQVRDAGLLRRRTGWYAAMIAVNALATGAVWTAVVLLGGTGT
ncbi:MAG: acyl-CoA desaturase, partial [Actinomycetia bacterium]|nr:acyl-CoA desaturase [Actinomycetes bacterium]